MNDTEEQLNAQKTLGWKLVKLKARISRGQSWTDYFRYIVYVFAGVRLAEDILTRFFGVPAEAFKVYYMYLPILYFITIYVMGWIDEMKGIWKLESVYNYRELNPYFSSFEEKLKSLESKVDKMIEAKK